MYGSIRLTPTTLPIDNAPSCSNKDYVLRRTRWRNDKTAPRRHVSLKFAWFDGRNVHRKCDNSANSVLYLTIEALHGACVEPAGVPKSQRGFQ